MEPPFEDPREQLTNRLAAELGEAIASQLVGKLVEVRGEAVAVLTLLGELSEVSAKAARAAIEALPELDRRTSLSVVSPWLDLGVALAESSGATALKYFKETPLILGLIEEPEGRAAVLAIGLELAELGANITTEFLRSAPQMLSVLKPQHMKPWLEIGIEFTQIDVIVGLEYIRRIPTLVPVLPLDEIRPWLSFGMKLISPNSLGRPDYLATMEFLRTSPAILGDIECPPVRSKVVALGALLADRSTEAGIAWLAESPGLMRRLPSADWQMKVLQYGLLLAERDAEATLSYLRRCPDVIGLIGPMPQAGFRFEDWFKAGMEVLAYSSEGARAYFAVESQKALASVEQAMSGVPLRKVARRVKLFVEGLCGTEVAIAALPDSMIDSNARATVSADGRTIFLPAMLRRYPTADENERLYLVMAAHEAGHLEFGTYQFTLEGLADLIEAVRRRYGRTNHPMPDSLVSLFRLYPHPRLIQDLWTVLEDARVEFLLQEEYPGLRRDLARLAGEAVTPRDPAHGLTAKELIVDCLLRLSTGESETSAVPHALKDEVSLLWQLCQPIFSSRTTAEETVRLAHALYVRMEELLVPQAEMIQRDQTQAQSPGGPAASEQSGDGYRQVTNWIYRGAMNPEFITRDQQKAAAQQPQSGGMASPDGGSQERTAGGSHSVQESASGDALGGGRSLPSVVEELLALDVDQRPAAETAPKGEHSIHYPEWDHAIQDYRMQWCRVVERSAEAGSDEFVSATLTKYRSVIRSLRRFFENLHPPAFRRVPGQTEGEDVDLDAVVRRAAELLAGVEGGDHVYVRREKKDRDVAVAFLIDVSGSTSRQIEGGRRVIDIEKESLVLLCEALDAVGDQYALYAYSGHGRSSVDFLTIKEFDERLGASTARRVGGLRPLQQNRDGAAIRHAAAKLLARQAKTRLLILLSDGRPLDGEYKDEYSLEDTKVALREGRRRGIHPFCVTVDREADSYLRRMYGDVQFTVIDRIEALPMKLPRIYRQLTT